MLLAIVAQFAAEHTPGLVLCFFVSSAKRAYIKTVLLKEVSLLLDLPRKDICVLPAQG